MKRYVRASKSEDRRIAEVRKVLESVEGKDLWVLASFVLNNSALFDNSWCFARINSVYDNSYGVGCECHIIPVACSKYDSVDNLKRFMYDYDFLDEFEYLKHIYLDNSPVILSSDELIRSYESGDKYLGGIWED